MLRLSSLANVYMAIPMIFFLNQAVSRKRHEKGEVDMRRPPTF